MKLIYRIRTHLLAACFLLPVAALAGGGAAAQPFVEVHNPDETASTAPRGALDLDRDAVFDAMKKARDFLQTRKLTFDEYWICRKTGSYLGGEFQEWAEALPKVEHDDPHALELLADAERPLKTPPEISHPAEVSPRVVLRPYSMPRDKFNHMTTFVRTGTHALADCDAESIEKTLRYFARPGSGYYLTHQLWVLAMLYHAGCVNDDKFLELAPAMAELVLEELLADDKEFTDITAERAAFLCFAGLASWVPEHTIRMALDSQLESGAWEVTKELPTDHQAHQAALAMFMLAHVWKEGKFAEAGGGE